LIHGFGVNGDALATYDRRLSKPDGELRQQGYDKISQLPRLRSHPADPYKPSPLQLFPPSFFKILLSPALNSWQVGTFNWLIAAIAYHAKVATTYRLAAAISHPGSENNCAHRVAAISPSCSTPISNASLSQS